MTLHRSYELYTKARGNNMCLVGYLVPKRTVYHITEFLLLCTLLDVGSVVSENLLPQSSG
jgi:hypothetical protein